MSAGTLTLTNNSAAVSGSGTAFTTDLVAGDFVVAVVGGITYTLPVKSVESATSLTLISNYPGPTQTGVAWNAVPRATQNQITAALVAQTTEALRGLNYDKSNWQAVFSDSGDITVILPDGSSFTGPSWKKISDLLAGIDPDHLQQIADQVAADAQQVAADRSDVDTKASQVSSDASTASQASTDASSANTTAQQAKTDAVAANAAAQQAKTDAEAAAASVNADNLLQKSNNLSDLAGVATARTNLGLKGAALLDVGTSSGTVAAGNDSRLNSLESKSGGTVNGTITLGKADSTWSYGMVLTATAGSEGARFRSANITTFNDASSRVVTTLDSVSTSRLSTLYPTGGIICKAGSGAANPQLNSYSIAWTGTQATLYIDSSLIGAISVTAVSDRELKEDIKYVTDSASAATEVLEWRVASFKYKARGIIPQSDEKLGFIANDLVQVSPECVKGEGLAPGNTDENATTAYYLDPMAMIAKLTQAIQTQQKQLNELQSIVNHLSSGS